VKLEPDAYAEIIRRLVSLRDSTAELADAYEDPVTKKGAEEMRDSLDRVLQLLEHRE
jgi:cellulose biosynthesis protein BcsQ